MEIKINHKIAMKNVLNQKNEFKNKYRQEYN